MPADRKERMLSRLDKATLSEPPDNATLYALEHLHARLAIVTDPKTAHATLQRLSERVDEFCYHKTFDSAYIQQGKEALLDLLRAKAVLSSKTSEEMPQAIDLPDNPDEILDELLEAVESLDISLSIPDESSSEPESVYRAHRWIASANRRLTSGD